MNKNFKTILCISGLAGILYILLFLIIPIDKNIAGNWLQLLFTIIAFAVVICAGFLFSEKENIKSRFYHLPLLRIAVYYLIFQIVFSIAVYILNKLILVPLRLGCAVSLIALVLALIGLISNKEYAETVESMDERLAYKTAPIREFRLDTDSVITKTTDPEIKNKLKKFAEEVRYSDPVSNPGAEKIEIQLNSLMSELSDEIDSGNKEEALKTIDSLNSVLIQRNRLIKSLKS